MDINLPQSFRSFHVNKLQKGTLQETISTYDNSPKSISDYFLVSEWYWYVWWYFFLLIFSPFRETDVLEITAASIEHSVFSSDSCGDAQSSLDKHDPQRKSREKLESFIFQILLKSPDSPTAASHECTYGRRRAKRELTLTEGFITSS